MQILNTAPNIQIILTMSSEDQEILARIGKLAGESIATSCVDFMSPPILIFWYAGQINRHKSGRSSDSQDEQISTSRATPPAGIEPIVPHFESRFDKADVHSQQSSGWRPHRGNYGSRGYGRGSRGQLHRNRTLVLNSNTSTPQNPGTPDTGGENPESAGASTPTSRGWVTKTDRHLQLINASIFENHSQSRTKAIEETRKQRLKQKDARERARFSKHLHRIQGNTGMQQNASDSSEIYEMSVQGVRFRVAKNGSKLVKVQGMTISFRSVMERIFFCDHMADQTKETSTRQKLPQRQRLWAVLDFIEAKTATYFDPASSERTGTVDR